MEFNLEKIKATLKANRSAALVVGFEHISFEAKDTKQKITGVSVYVLTDIGNRESDGLKTDKFFLTSDKLSRSNLGGGLKVGMLVEPSYSRYGKVNCLTLVESDTELVSEDVFADIVIDSDEIKM